MEEPTMRDILNSTLSVIFMGSPHRDTQYGRMDDAVRSMGSAMLKVDGDDSVLNDVSGANRASLNLGRHVFIRLWNDYNFKVKTYQERHPLASTLREERPEHVSRAPLDGNVGQLQLMRELKRCSDEMQAASATRGNRQN